MYEAGFSGTASQPVSSFQDLFGAALDFVDHSIRANRREDGLFHSYNLLDVSEAGEARIEPLYEMLEGQVAVLSAGVLDPEEASRLIDALFASSMYRPDQQSFMLYPARSLPGFLQKNIIPQQAVENDALLTHLVQSGDTSLVVRDAAGHFRFHSGFSNAADLAKALDHLAERSDLRVLVDQQRLSVLNVYESVFQHRAFTGRSGTMYGYEGLGCIYWHMVSKLLLAVQECHFDAVRRQNLSDSAPLLASQYYRLRDGMGFNKTAHQFGAFPADPYSHTPAHAGARQPGMTGQAKEDILLRWGELGVSVEGGCLAFAPSLLRRREFLSVAQSWSYFGLDGEPREIEVPAGGLAFTLYSVPIVFHLSADSCQIIIHEVSGRQRLVSGSVLDSQSSEQLFQRSGIIDRLEVHLPEASLTLE